MSGFVQYGANGSGTNDVQSLIVSLATLATTGNTILVASTGGGKATFVGDNKGNVYNVVASVNAFFGSGSSVWMAYNITGGFVGITATYANAFNPAGLIAQEFTGTGATNPIDLKYAQSTDQSSSATPFMSAGSATATANEIIVPFCFTASGVADPLSGISSPYTNPVSTGALDATSGSIGSGSNVVSAIVTAVATFSFSTPRTWFGGIFSLELAGAPPPTTITPHLMSSMGIGQ